VGEVERRASERGGGVALEAEGWGAEHGLHLHEDGAVGVGGLLCGSDMGILWPTVLMWPEVEAGANRGEGRLLCGSGVGAEEKVGRRRRTGRRTGGCRTRERAWSP
jgi:hypothetical protein